MMMFRTSILALVVVAVGGLSVDDVNVEGSEMLVTLFNEWKNLYGKIYTTAEEEINRAHVWFNNNMRILEHNKNEESYTLGHNAFSDMTEREFQEYFKLGEFSNNYIPPEFTNSFSDDEEVASQRRALQDSQLTLPDYVNWVQMGGVTRVKNQGACGSCWAFSTTGALEGAKFVKTGELVELSEQNLLDCDHEDLACNGGLMDNAFKFDEKSGGLCSEADYPYEARKHRECFTNCTDVPGSIVKTFVDVPPGDERGLLAAIAMQPIAIAVSAGSFAFQFYKTGVITDTSCGSTGQIDHGVLAVGYGTDLDKQIPYFLVKNSWGDDWGDEGYLKIGRNTTHKYGICSILKMASFPIVE